MKTPNYLKIRKVSIFWIIKSKSLFGNGRYSLHVFHIFYNFSKIAISFINIYHIINKSRTTCGESMWPKMLTYQHTIVTKEHLDNAFAVS